jgi:hypothetical protein
MRNLGVVALFALLGLVWWSARGRADQAPGEPAAPDSVPEAPAQAAKAPPPPPSPAPAAVPRVRALETLIRTISAASISGAPQPAQRLCEDLRLPDYATWFARRFGAEAGGRLAAEYAPFGTLPDLFRKLHAEGRTELLVERHDDPADPQATGYQSVALGAMKEHATLYSVRLLRPEESSGYSLWSFVYADGGFRFAGKMRDVSPEERSRDAAQLGELRRADAEHFLETGNFPGDD